MVLRLVAGQAETLWDEALPIEVRELPEDLAALDVLLDDPALLSHASPRRCTPTSTSTAATTSTPTSRPATLPPAATP